MPHVMHAPRLHPPRTSTDQLWAIGTMAVAGLGLVLALAEAFDAAAIVAFLGVVAGGWAMLISRTRTERFEVVIATVLCAVILASALAYGSGFSFGGVL